MLIEINVLNPLRHQLITKIYGFISKKKKREKKMNGREQITGRRRKKENTHTPKSPKYTDGIEMICPSS